MLEWMRQVAIEVATWLYQLVQVISGIFLYPIFAALNWAVGIIPVPDAFDTLVNAWQSVSSEAGYLLDVFQVGWGLTMYFGALALRWILRRIPFIGG